MMILLQWLPNNTIPVGLYETGFFVHWAIVSHQLFHPFRVPMFRHIKCQCLYSFIWYLFIFISAWIGGMSASHSPDSIQITFSSLWKLLPLQLCRHIYNIYTIHWNGYCCHSMQNMVKCNVSIAWVSLFLSMHSTAHTLSENCSQIDAGQTIA